MTDARTIHMVIIIQAVLCLGFGVAAYILAQRKGEYTAFIGLAGTALGNLGSILVSTRSKPVDPQPVIGPAGAPVLVEVQP